MKHTGKKEMRAYIADSQMLCWKIMSKLPFFHMIPNLLVISGVTGISTKSLGLAAIEEYRKAPHLLPRT